MSLSIQMFSHYLDIVWDFFRSCVIPYKRSPSRKDEAINELGGLSFQKSIMRKEPDMLLTLVVILLILWLLGVAVNVGFIIHLLLMSSGKSS